MVTEASETSLQTSQRCKQTGLSAGTRSPPVPRQFEETGACRPPADESSGTGPARPQNLFASGMTAPECSCPAGAHRPGFAATENGSRQSSRRRPSGIGWICQSSPRGGIKWPVVSPQESAAPGSEPRHPLWECSAHPFAAGSSVHLGPLAFTDAGADSVPLASTDTPRAAFAG